MQFIVCDNYEEISLTAAKFFAEQIKANPESVLGLATGSTPLGMYSKLIEMNKNGEISFSKCKSFNLDEYYPLSPENEQSYRYYMQTNFFNHIDIEAQNTNVPDGMAQDPTAACKKYDEKIEKAGGIDIQVLGIGRNGHIAFNEPDEYLYAGTHITDLTESTIKANARFFESENEVPKQAATMGMASILKAKKIILLASGKDKHDAIKGMLDDRITTQNPATLLKVHPNTILICDKDAYQG